jgi:glucose/arabinose dehydrogenase
MDIDSLVGSNRNEQGLLSIAFHPDFANTGRLFVNYTDNSGDTVVAGYDVTADGQLVDLATALVILTIPQPHANHNGGQLQFGPDGYLYIGTGDGGSANDPYGNGQNPAALLGKMLRIAVDGEPPYQIPADNPFLDQADFLPEIWSLGLRNPWRFSFDRSTGDLYIADVGQNQYEEVNLQPAGQGGLNYGWSIMEGAHCFQSGQCDSAGLTQPLAEYDHGQGCSVTGGHVYRGAQFPALAGVYLYGDFCSGKIWGVRPGGQAVELLDTDMSISSFGEDETGELYVMDYRGSVYQIRAN